MKLRISEYLRELREGLAATQRLHPVEVALALVGSALVIMAVEYEWANSYVLRLTLLPIFFAVALIVNQLAGQGPWRRVYRVSWVPLVPLALWPGVTEWICSVSCGLTLGAVLPLGLLLARRAADNRRFTADALVYLRAAVLATVLANIALGLFEAIIWSTAYIFVFTGAAWLEVVARDAALLTQTLCVPLLFLVMVDRWQRSEVRGGRVLEVLLHWIVTPALVVYTAILYLYMAKILFTWSLPRGGVAYMVFGFTLLALLVGALRPLLDRRRYDWFFDRLSWIALPPAVLFWAGVARRVAEYGLTEARIYLIVCGAVMTLALLLFLSRRTGRYLYVAAAACALFAALAYVPQLDPERMAVRQQMERAQRIARDLGRLDGEGHLLLTPVPMADTVRREEYRRLYEAVTYLWLSREDKVRMAQLGINTPEDMLEPLPADFAEYVHYGREASATQTVDESHTSYYYLPHDMLFETDARFGRVAFPERNGSCMRDDTLRIDVRPGIEIRIAESDFLRRQLPRTGLASWGRMTQSDAHRAALLDYSDEHCRILFDNIDLRGCDSTGWHISYASVEAVFLP